MKAGIIFTGTGPILILTSYDSLVDPALAEKFTQKGITKYIACEIDPELAKRRYGKKYDIIMGDLKQSDDLRVLDYNGFHVFHNFSFKEMSAPQFHEFD